MEDAGPPEACLQDPLRRIDWDVVREAAGVEVAAVIEEVGANLVPWARDAVIAQHHVLKGRSHVSLPP